MTPETEQQHTETPTYAGDADGLHAAADELLRKRSAETEAVEGPGDMSADQGAVDLDSAIKLSDAAQEVTKWREQREKEREAFNRAVLGEQLTAQELAWQQQVEEAEAAADQLEEKVGKEELALAKREATEERGSPTPQAAPLNVVDVHLNQQVAAHHEAARQQLVATLAASYPELQDWNSLNNLRSTDPARYVEVSTALANAETGWRFMTRPYRRKPPKPAAHTKPTGRATRKTSILRASRHWAAKKDLATRPRPKTIPQVQRPGARGATVSEGEQRESNLERRLDKSGSVRDATRLLIARRAASNRR
jgi:hypothetical protein